VSPCRSCNGTGIANGKPCDAVPDDPIEGHDLSQCVYGLMVSPWWSAAVSLDAASQRCGLSDWPGGWSCGIVDALAALHTERLRAEAREAKRAAARARR